jgi:hypothetical protein
LFDGEAEVATLRGADDDGAGAALLGADLDGDGVDDLLVGAVPRAQDARWLWLVPGPIEGEQALADAPARLDAAEAAEALHLAGPCDLDGDGQADVLASLSTPLTAERWSYDRHFLRGADLEDQGWESSASDQPDAPACGDSDGDGFGEIAAIEVGGLELSDRRWQVRATLDLDEPATVAFTPDGDLLLGLPERDGVWLLAGGPGF